MLKTLLSFLIILLLFISTIGYVAYQVTRPGFLVKSAEDVHLYEQATAQASTFLPKDALGNLPLTTGEIQTVLAKSIDANTFYTDLGKVSDGYLDYLTGRSDQLKFKLDLRPIKDNLEQQATAVVVADYQALPTCQTNQLHNWNATSEFPKCQLPSGNLNASDVTNLLANQVAQAVSPLPNFWQSGTPSQSLSQTRARVMQVLELVRITWLSTLIVILLYILIGRRRAFLPLAFIFLIAGALEVAFSFVAWDFLKKFIVDLLSQPGTSQQLLGLMNAIADDLTQTLKTIFGNLSIVTLSIGGFFLILWAFTRFARPKKELPLQIPRT